MTAYKPTAALPVHKVFTLNHSQEDLPLRYTDRTDSEKNLASKDMSIIFLLLLM